MPANKVREMGYVLEPQRRIPVIYDVDVVVAGGGISGLFAALAAGKMGASTLLIDRFGTLGGNLGPGYLVGGNAINQVEEKLGESLPSVPEEFFTRLKELRETPESNYADTSNLVTYLGFKMAEEVGVELLLSAYASDPIVDGGKVRGLFIEGKSGRTAVKSGVVIDATGNAEIARRAGAGIINNVSEDYSCYGDLLENTRRDFVVYNESGLFFFIGGSDYEKYKEFVTENKEIREDDRRWAEEHLRGRKVSPFPDAVTPLVRKAWEAGEFRTVKELGNPDITISSYGSIGKHGWYGNNVIGARAAIAAGEIDMGNTKHVSLVEKELRMHAFETVQFLKKYVPGFEDAYLMYISPFAGARGGPCIQGEHTLTVEESATGKRFCDVMFQSFGRRPQIYDGEWVQTGCDVPYRMILPEGMDNILVIGRGAAYVRRGHNGAGSMRSRPIMMALGQAAGTAASLCSTEGTTPMTLEVKRLQKELLDQGFNLGNEDRLQELGLLP